MRRALQATGDYLSTLARWLPGACPWRWLGLQGVAVRLPGRVAPRAGWTRLRPSGRSGDHDPHAYRLLKPDPREALDDLPHPPLVQSKAGSVWCR